MRKNQQSRTNLYLKIAFSQILIFFNVFVLAGTFDDSCPIAEPSLSETDFPGFDPKNIKSFSRDQDSIGNCYGFMWADFLAFHAKKKNAWPEGAMYAQGASALDTMLQLSIIAGRQYPSVDLFITAGGFDVKEFSQRTADHMSKVGLCAEKSFPSEFLPVETGALDTYTSFAKYFDKTRASNVVSSDLNSCPDCVKIAPNIVSKSILGGNAKKISSFLFELKQKENSFQALRLLNEKSCPVNERVKFPRLKMNQSDSLNAVNEQILKNNPVMVSLGPEAVMTRQRMEAARKRVGDKDYRRVPSHAALLVGATKIPELGDRCYYIIKNSWGDHCEADLPGQVCMESGAMGIRADLFKAQMIDGRWAE